MACSNRPAATMAAEGGGAEQADDAAAGQPWAGIECNGAGRVVKVKIMGLTGTTFETMHD